MVDLSRQTALAGRTLPENTSISIREITGRGMIDLRGLPMDRKFMAAFSKA